MSVLKKTLLSLAVLVIVATGTALSFVPFYNRTPFRIGVGVILSVVLYWAAEKSCVEKKEKMKKDELKIELRSLLQEEEETFIRENQAAFDKAAIEEFGPQKESVIDRKTIADCLHGKFADAFRIIADDIPVGGVVVDIYPDTQRGELNLLYINADCHSRGVGQKVWQMIEAKYPDIKVWETYTPYFEKRNIHFYVNKCGFHIVEFYNPHHPMPNEEPSTLREENIFSVLKR